MVGGCVFVFRGGWCGEWGAGRFCGGLGGGWVGVYVILGVGVGVGVACRLLGGFGVSGVLFSVIWGGGGVVGGSSLFFEG